jgi:hypothetical protein
MYRALVHLRRPLTFAAMLLLAVAYWHCAWEWAAELKHLGAISHSAANPSLPASPVQGCENESGCICQGATLAHQVGADCLAAEELRWQLACPPVAWGEVGIADGDLCERIPKAQRTAPPVSGRQLRALYASLLI